MTTVLFIVTLLVMIIGLAGVVVPLLPGIPLIFLAFGVYGWLTDWQEVSVWAVVVMAVVAFFSLIIDYTAAAVGAKKYGASRSGVWGAILGGFLGVIVLNFFGLIIGPLVGAFIGELIDGKPHPLAAKATWGSMAGLLAGSFVKIIIGVVMIGVWFWLILG